MAWHGMKNGLMHCIHSLFGIDSVFLSTKKEECIMDGGSGRSDVVWCDVMSEESWYRWSIWDDRSSSCLAAFRSSAHYLSAWHNITWHAIGTGVRDLSLCPSVMRSRLHRIRFDSNPIQFESDSIRSDSDPFWLCPVFRVVCCLFIYACMHACFE